MTRHLAAAATLALVLGAASCEPAAAAGARAIALTHQATGGDDRLEVTLYVRTSPGALCRGRVGLGRRSSRLGDVRTGHHGGARWRWRVADDVPAGRWRARVRCRLGSGWATAHRRFRVQAGPDGDGTGRLISGAIVSGRYPAPDPGTGQGSDGANLYPRGQCTWYVATLRPDLPFFEGAGGDARNWARSARKHGFAVGSTPEVGAVAVFQPHQQHAGFYGHVAYVLEVDGDSILIEEANYRSSPPGHRRWVAWAGLEFIYKGQSGGTNDLTPPGTAPFIVQGTCEATDCGLRRRRGPGYSHEIVNPKLAEGTRVGVSCDVQGDLVTDLGMTSEVWMRLGDGSWVSGVYLRPVDGASAGTVPRCRDLWPGIPPGTPVTHFACAGGADDVPHAVPAGRYWGDAFTAVGTTVTGGVLSIASTDPVATHRAKVGIYQDARDGRPLGETVVEVGPVRGVAFAFDPPVRVEFGERLYLTITGIDDIVVFDEQSARDCIVGRLAGSA
ncbi:MAG TPA: CHAP domain-containing protein [Capillimicrobium sp.]|nr:CHAP domain-containing protein [Capillimicrobium sp.]